MTTSSTWLSRAAAAALRTLLLLAGLVFGLSALVAGAVLAIVLAIVGLVSGRRPVLRTGFGSAATGGAGTYGFRRGPARPAVRRPEVIDVEMREVAEPTPPSDALPTRRTDDDRA